MLQGVLKYSSKGGSEGSIALDRIYGVRQGLDRPTLTQNPALEFQFTLTDTERTIRLRAETPADCKDWIKTIQQHCGRSARKSGTSGRDTQWKIAQDPNGRTYYYNKTTGERTWHPPGATADAMNRAGGGVTLLSRSASAGSTTPIGRPIYTDEHDPPTPGPKILDLHIRHPGFFGVYLDEVADGRGRTHVCVRAIEPGSEAHIQCPQLIPGMYGMPHAALK